jgi:HK97 family phage portal protein
MSLRTWISRRFGLTDGAVIAALFGGESWAGKSVTPSGALNVSAWWRCTKLYGEVVASLPLKFYERKDDDTRVLNRDHEVAKVLLDPNADQTSWEYWAGVGSALSMLGNSISEKQYSGKRLVALQPLGIDCVRPYRNTDGELYYKGSERGKQVELPAEKVFHVRGFSIPGINYDLDMGMSPLAYARQTLGITIATEQAVGSTFANGMRATGVFSWPDNPTPQQQKDFTNRYVKPLTGAENEGKQMMLPPGFKWQPISIPPKDVEMLLSRRFNVEDVCRWMGVPPILAGHAAEGQTMWGTGVENIFLAWLSLGLDSLLCNVEKSINKWLLSPADRLKYYAEFDRNGLLRADSAARGDFVNKMMGAAQLTPNEGRKAQNLPPMEGGDKLYINSTYVPLDQAGARPPKVATP